MCEVEEQLWGDRHCRTGRHPIASAPGSYLAAPHQESWVIVVRWTQTNPTSSARIKQGAAYQVRPRFARSRRGTNPASGLPGNSWCCDCPNLDRSQVDVYQ